MQKTPAILGIDTGTRRCGVGFLDANSGNYVLATSVDLVSTRKGFDRAILAAIHTHDLLEVAMGTQALSGYYIHAIGIELPWIGKNSQSSLVLAMAAGAIIGMLYPICSNVVGVQPAQAKAAIDGPRASKETIHRILSLEYGLSTATYDMTDALAVARYVRNLYLEEKMSHGN